MRIFGYEITIKFRRSKYPLIHKARKIYRAGGDPALDKWLKTLSEAEKEELVGQYVNLLTASFDIALEIILKNKKEGKIK